MTSKDLGKLKLFGFTVVKGNVYIDITFQTERQGAIEFQIQKGREKEVSFRQIIEKVYQNGFANGQTAGRLKLQIELKGALGISIMD